MEPWEEGEVQTWGAGPHGFWGEEGEGTRAGAGRHLGLHSVWRKGRAGGSLSGVGYPWRSAQHQCRGEAAGGGQKTSHLNAKLGGKAGARKR